MRGWRLTFAMLLATSGAGAVAAQDSLDGASVDAILEIAKTHGSASLEQQQNGDPRIAGVSGGIPYQVFFMNCGGSEGCEDINFYAGFAGIKPTLDAMNAWNRDKRFGNAYLDSELDAVIEYDVNLEYGVSRDNMDAAFGLWALLVSEFAGYVGYTAQ